MSFIFSLFLASQVFALEKLTLQDCLKIALEKSLSLNSSRRDLEIKELEKKNALFKFFPVLSLSATHGLQGQNPASGSPSVSQISLNLTENLYDNHVSIKQYQIATLRKKISEIQYSKDREALTRDLSLEFYKLSESFHILKIQETLVDIIANQYGIVNQSFHQGLKTKKDVMRFRTQLSRAELDLATQRQEIEKSKQEVLKIMAVPLTDKRAFDFLPEEVSGNIPDQFEKKIDLYAHFDYRIADLQKETAELEYDMVARNAYPVINLTSQLSYKNSDYLSGGSFSDNGVYSGNILLSINFNLFDWGTRIREASIGNEQKEIKRNNFDTTLIALRTELEKLWLDLDRLRRNFKLTQELLKMEEGNFSALEKDYREGRVQYLDLITALKDLSDARGKFVSSYFEFRRLSSLYLYHEGRLYEAIQKN